jgi:hypothetical protein
MRMKRTNIQHSTPNIQHPMVRIRGWMRRSGKGHGTLWVRLLAVGLLWGGAAQAAIKQEIPPLKPPHEALPASVDREDPLPWFIGAGVVAVLAAIVAWPRAPKQKIVETPAAIANRELRTMDASDPMVVAQVLRRYLIATFPLPGPGATTEEITGILTASTEGDTVLAHEISDFLAACDTAKFAPDLISTPASNAANALTWIEKIEMRRRQASQPQPEAVPQS